MKYGIQHSSSQRYAEGVVDECEEKILTDVAHRALAQPTSFDDAPKVALDQRDSASLHCHVGSSAHRDSHMRLGECGSIVHSITGHRDDCPLRLEFLHNFGLLLRQDIRFEIDAQLLCDGRSGCVIVASDHY